MTALVQTVHGGYTQREPVQPAIMPVAEGAAVSPTNAAADSPMTRIPTDASSPASPSQPRSGPGRAAASTVRAAWRSIRKSARAAHDKVTERRHCQKLGGLLSSGRSDRYLDSEAVRETGLTVRVKILAAVDLREERAALHTVATCDAYCLAGLHPAGGVGLPVSALRERHRGGDSRNLAATAVVPRQRHPRWHSGLVLHWPHRCPPGHSLGSGVELTVRVMDSRTIGQDTHLGEVRIDLEREPQGARALRLLGGGFASICIRWSAAAADEDVEPGAPDSPSLQSVRLPFGMEGFEHALAFWEVEMQKLSSAGASMESGGLADRDKALRAMSGRLATEMRDLEDLSVLNHLIMQAPLTSLLGLSLRTAKETAKQDDATACLNEPFMSALLEVWPALRGEPRGRLAGALVEYLGHENLHSGARQCAEQLLHDLFCSAAGRELLDLKNIVDTGGCRDLRGLMGMSFCDEALRSELLMHFQAAAELMDPRPLHILSDIDMTVRVGKFGRGGPKFPHGRVPGALPLFRSLGSRVTFLSARPPQCRAATRRLLLEDVGIAEATVLHGDLAVVLRSLIWREKSFREMGSKKIEAFADFEALYPEADFLFFGDSGEGDLDFALHFVSSSDTRLAFIHDVVDDIGVTPFTSRERREELAQRNVFVFDSYAGAAVRLHDAGLLTGDGLRAAAQGCHDEFEGLHPGVFAQPIVYFKRRAELIRDLELVNEALRSYAGAEELVDVRLNKEDEIEWWRL
eukprot:TRINITY_DN31478_c0_g1_i1.p1 TRINITY_DN31478_c0_g1~~TRINITY_DN31478_c0_g1_i1.p1  ORF type:complete len:747 (-),score=129.19 TRINITY_DN31478_c0_g1_i1:139-2379(-)